MDPVSDELGFAFASGGFVWLDQTVEARFNEFGRFEVCEEEENPVGTGSYGNVGTCAVW